MTWPIRLSDLTSWPLSLASCPSSKEFLSIHRPHPFQPPRDCFRTPSCASQGTSFWLSSLSSGISSSMKPSPAHFFPLQRLFVPGILLWVYWPPLSLQSVLRCPSTWESGWLRAGAWMLNGWMNGSIHSTILNIYSILAFTKKKIHWVKKANFKRSLNIWFHLLYIF